MLKYERFDRLSYRRKISILTHAIEAYFVIYYYDSIREDVFNRSFTFAGTIEMLQEHINDIEH